MDVLKAKYHYTFNVKFKTDDAGECVENSVHGITTIEFEEIGFDKRRYMHLYAGKNFITSFLKENLISLSIEWTYGFW